MGPRGSQHLPTMAGKVGGDVGVDAHHPRPWFLWIMGDEEKKLRDGNRPKGPTDQALVWVLLWS